MEYDFKDVAEKLVAGGMDEAHVNASITALKDAYASVPDEEILKKIENAGGAEAIASGILKNYGLTQPEEKSAGETGEGAVLDAGVQTDVHGCQGGKCVDTLLDGIDFLSEREFIIGGEGRAVEG